MNRTDLPPELQRRGATVHRRPVRSFVRREGRMTPAQEAALERLWGRFGIAAESQIDTTVAFGRQAPLSIEIGFGTGDHLAASALARPDWNFIGIEVHRPGVGRLLQVVEQREIGNVRVACHDAVEVLRDRLPAGSVDEVVIFFPDPWPKKKHHKRRLIQQDFAELLARVLRPGGRLRLATDWKDYADHMLEVFNAAAGFANAAVDGRFVPRPADRPLTRFENRGLRLGHEVFDLEYRRL
jgi:tRNA (guanine-N7-)-methyltransferase